MPAKKSANTTTTRQARVIRLHEATGSSAKGWAHAVGDALRRAKSEVPTPLAVEVVRQWADVAGARITRYHVTVRIAWSQTLLGPAASSARARK